MKYAAFKLKLDENVPDFNLTGKLSEMLLFRRSTQSTSWQSCGTKLANPGATCPPARPGKQINRINANNKKKSCVVCPLVSLHFRRACQIEALQWLPFSSKNARKTARKDWSDFARR